MTMTILLRKMTRKSVFKEGRFTGYTVQKILDLDKPDYLIWTYFNIEKLTFIDEILDKLGIIKKWRIQKPSIDKENGKKFIKLLKKSTKYKKKYYEIDVERKKKERKKEVYSLFHNTASKGNMQSINHGYGSIPVGLSLSAPKMTIFNTWTEETKEKAKEILKKSRKGVIQFYKNGNIKKFHENCVKAAKKTGHNKYGIRYACKNKTEYKGFFWRYENEQFEIF